MINIIDLLSIEDKKRINTVNLKKGQILFNEGEICTSIGIVIEGEIEIVSYSYEGKEISLNQLSQGMIFGNNLIFSSDKHYKGSIIAKSPAKVGLIGEKDIIYILKNNDDFLLKYLNYQADIGKELNSKIKLLSIDNMEERFFYFLHLNKERIVFKSITNLAASLYIQRETLSRLISRLVKENKIIKEKHRILKNQD